MPKAHSTVKLPDFDIVESPGISLIRFLRQLFSKSRPSRANPSFVQPVAQAVFNTYRSHSWHSLAYADCIPQLPPSLYHHLGYKIRGISEELGFEDDVTTVFRDPVLKISIGMRTNVADRYNLWTIACTSTLPVLTAFLLVFMSPVAVMTQVAIWT
ncbi:uncharacterized protein ARMOST_20567 [Armillaria ostoyae]|uniref:Uncharacterized protein n=1 Tax=Armillaria ostoyae TaxID=47428 RepID=A0A284S7U2_ARMOS|nr:uncharacterized protein ARMOST_20567 [Armillaria ostoyae]